MPTHNGERRQPKLRHNLGVYWGQKVGARRRYLGFSQQQLADLCGISQQAVSKIEAGEMIPLDRLKVTIAAKLGTTPADIFPWPPMAELVAEEGAA